MRTRRFLDPESPSVAQSCGTLDSPPLRTKVFLKARSPLAPNWPES